MPFKRDVEIGERFSPVSLTSVGNASSIVLEVRKIRVEGCVVPHAILVNITTPSDQRLISVDALRDRNFYRAIGFQSNEAVGTDIRDGE